ELIPIKILPNPEPRNPNPEPRTPNPEPRTPNPEPRTPNPEPRTPNPEPKLQAQKTALKQAPLLNGLGYFFNL
ncbi:MAG: hypothetical protein ACI8Z6_001789, partial [Pseudoalteromonas tetraodonis]